MFQDSNSGIFVESPSSYSSPTPARNQNDCEDHLHVCLLKATLEAEAEESSCCHDFRPYVVLEMDHPAQRYRTTKVQNRKYRNNMDGFTWPETSNFEL